MSGADAPRQREIDSIELVVRLTDGVIVKALITPDGIQRWGETVPNLGRVVDVTTDMFTAASPYLAGGE